MGRAIATFLTLNRIWTEAFRLYHLKHRVRVISRVDSNHRHVDYYSTALSKLSYSELVRSERFELPTFRFVAGRSIQLSYERNI